MYRELHVNVEDSSQEYVLNIEHNSLLSQHIKWMYSFLDFLETENAVRGIGENVSTPSEGNFTDLYWLARKMETLQVTRHEWFNNQ